MANIPREPLLCMLCQSPLRGELDTFGEPGQEICYDCWVDLPEQNETWYGMAPHHHDLTLTGSFIGSTVFDAIPEPDANGVIVLSDGRFFVPDAEVDGAQGTYYLKYPFAQGGA
jgi:hypothetical protein